MIPWERDIYVNMLINYIKEENEKSGGGGRESDGALFHVDAETQVSFKSQRLLLSL